MTYFEQLLDQTREARESLVATPIIQECLRGQVALPAYVAFLREAYHHVSHTVPLMYACRARMPARLDWMQEAIDEYIEEETGHDAWILNDLRALGQDADEVRRAGPGEATEVMVAYAYDTIARKNPVGFFGMVHVLEGTSVTLALNAADQIQRTLALPQAAFSYLRSHGTLDQEHTAHFAELMNRLDDDGDRAAVVRAANIFYGLYGAIFRALPQSQPHGKVA
ncbi:iron-containing redox enzyme family protein [Achromobacter sp. Bel]|uniref:TenA family transcriptional regulator n=1 Tax=Achromobacter sp. Bel TaxID=2727415 RepID=UPI00145F4F45|nr:iron-containing redox enzyme family protein [Achromobacter sp. Bel]NMK46442.1 iron-containing redox enzyme family protein [Achromobacter sp. Bel]